MSANTAMDVPSFEEYRVLVLFGSPHRNGETANLLRAFLEPLAGRCKVDVVDAYQELVAPCTGCSWCQEHEGCPIPDFDRIDSLLRKSDLLVVASPIYNLSFPAPLKAIFDRTQRYFSARFSLGIRPPIQKHRAAVLLTAAGSPDTVGEEIVSRQLKQALSVMNTTLEHTVSLRGTDQKTPEALAEAVEQAKRAALAILEKL